MNVWVRVGDPDLRRDLAEAARRAGHGAWEADVDGPPVAVPTHLDVAVVDVSDATGWKALRELQQRAPALRILALGDTGASVGVVHALRAGAHGFLRRPFDVESLERALESVGARGRRRRGDPLLVAEDPEMRRLLLSLERTARTDATVLLVGETGTGKTHLARWLHHRSTRAGSPCVEVACGAESAPEGSPLFRVPREPGSPWHRAAGGTLVLEEIERLPGEDQERLLAILQRRSHEASHPDAVYADVRIIATTRGSLDAEVERGGFSRALRDRLDVIRVQLPALRDRRSDIVPLAQRFLSSFAPPDSLPPPPLDAGLIAELQEHPFPGNLHELENWMRRNALQLPPTTEQGTPPGDDPTVFEVEGFDLRQIERKVIARSLEAAEGNRALAARALGISPRTLRNKIRRYQLD